MTKLWRLNMIALLVVGSYDVLTLRKDLRQCIDVTRYSTGNIEYPLRS